MRTFVSFLSNDKNLQHSLYFVKLLQNNILEMKFRPYFIKLLVLLPWLLIFIAKSLASSIPTM